MADLDDLLEKTSRTFALSIPRLPEPTRQEVGVAYLLFRIADNFEDSATWPRAKRIEALDVFCSLLETRQDDDARRWSKTWHAEVPIEHTGYQELVAEIPAVLDAYFALREPARELIREHTVRTARGMIRYVDRTDDDGELELDNLEELRDYCYVVAGIVGEMLTELFLLGREELVPHAGYLRQRARCFGEGLQLVNILKDCAFDATEGRTYLPPGVSPEEVFALARKDLEGAGEYVLKLQESGTDRGMIAFNALNSLLAFATLDHLEDTGPGTKISREQVGEIVAMLDYALDHGLPVLSLPETDAVSS